MHMYMYPNYVNYVWVQVHSSYVLIGKNEISKEGKVMICVNKFLMIDLLN